MKIKRKRKRIGKTKSIYVFMDFATGMVIVDSKDIIVGTPPIWKCWVGANYSRFYGFYERKGKVIKTEVMDRTQRRLKLYDRS